MNPCVPSPCGPFSVCRVVGNADLPSCTCMDDYIGTPPNCRPQCTIDSECASNRACLRQKCTDPCPGSCGTGAECLVVNHMAVCTCPQGFTGDSFVNCFLESPRKHCHRNLELYENNNTNASLRSSIFNIFSDTYRTIFNDTFHHNFIPQNNT